MRAHEFESQDLPSVERAQQAIPQILARAQRDYDAWDETDRDTYAGGGICHIIADSVCDVLSDTGIECTSVSCSHEQHVYVAARFAEGIYTIDIPYHVYEQGGGFSWKKLPDVKFEPRDVVFYRVSGDPADWRDYLDEGMRDVVNFMRNIGSKHDAPIVMMTNPQNTGARTASGQRMRIEDFPLKTVAVSELKPWEPMIKMRDLPSQRTVVNLTQTLRQGGRIPPLLVTPVRGGYRIIDGHHRYAALQRAGIDRVAVRVVDPRLIRYSDEVMEALRITLERYGHLGRRGDSDVQENLDAVSEVNSPGELSVDPELIKRFTDRGWEIDGEGRDQIVMSRPGARTVLKIVGQGTDTHTAEIRRAVRFFRDHQHNPHFPRVGLDRTLDWKGQKYYAYTQERLRPLSGDEEILDYLEYAMGEIGHGEDPDYSQAPPGLDVEQVDGLVSAIYDMFDEGMLTQINFDLGNVANIMQRANGQLVIVDPVSFDQDLAENFADGKKPGRKGLSRRVGIPQKATLGQLEKIARSSTGERRRMAQWQLNMRRGQAKKNK